VTKHLQVLASAGIIDGQRRPGARGALNHAACRARRHLDIIAREWDDALSRLKARLEVR
jgi:hypothetical protein